MYKKFSNTVIKINLAHQKVPKVSQMFPKRSLFTNLVSLICIYSLIMFYDFIPTHKKIQKQITMEIDF